MSIHNQKEILQKTIMYENTRRTEWQNMYVFEIHLRMKIRVHLHIIEVINIRKS